MISSVSRNRWASLCLGLFVALSPFVALAQLNTDSLRTRLANGRVWHLTSIRTSDENVLPPKSDLTLRFEPDASGVRQERLRDPDSTRRSADVQTTFQYVIITNGSESTIKFKHIRFRQGRMQLMATEPKLDADNGYRFRFVGDKKRLRLDSPYRGEGKPTIYYFFDPL